MFELFKTSIGRFRILAFAEGVSFLLILFVSMPLKYWCDIKEPNKVIGMIHVVLFLAYVVMVLFIKMDYNWTNKKTLLALLASVLPRRPAWKGLKGGQSSVLSLEIFFFGFFHRQPRFDFFHRQPRFDFFHRQPWFDFFHRQSGLRFY